MRRESNQIMKSYFVNKLVHVHFMYGTYLKFYSLAYGKILPLPNCCSTNLQWWNKWILDLVVQECNQQDAVTGDKKRQHLINYYNCQTYFTNFSTNTLGIFHQYFKLVLYVVLGSDLHVRLNVINQWKLLKIALSNDLVFNDNVIEYSYFRKVCLIGGVSERSWWMYTQCLMWATTAMASWTELVTTTGCRHLIITAMEMVIVS